MADETSRPQRATFQAAPRKQGAHPAVVIVTIVALVGAIGFFVWRVIDAQGGPVEKVTAPPTKDNSAEYNKIKKETTAAIKLKREAFALKESEDAAAFKAKCEEAKTALGAVLDRLDAMLEPVRDENGELPPEYSGYSQDYARVQTALHDVIKIAPF
ncbi:MAG: hypothetical protein AAF488_08005 [Planctomycetota bacterium]